MPPSVNSIWRSNQGAKLNVYRSKEYKKWMSEAGLALLVEYKLRGLKTIPGKFTAIIEIRRDWTAIERNKFDLDNRTKVLFDFCQTHGFIKNDLDLEEYTVKWTHGNALLRTLPQSRYASFQHEQLPASYWMPGLHRSRLRENIQQHWH